MWLWGAIVCIILMGVHLFSPGWRFVGAQPRSRWLSFGGGISVAYIFVHLLPALHAHQSALERVIEGPERQVYLVALLGLVSFYGLECLAKGSRRQRRQTHGEDRTQMAVFWIHAASFTLYNAIIAYLAVHRETADRTGLFLFGLAMALHFLVTDFGLREHHKVEYDRKGRWLFSGGVAAGWAAGTLSAVNEATVALLFAFLAGGTVLNVLKEELPEERESSFWAFLLGTAVYAALLLLI